MIEQNNIIIPKLELDSQQSLEHLLCWEKKDPNFSFYIFSIQFHSNVQLEEMWKKINNIIATYFQSNLNKNVEKWNIYLFFFVVDKVSRDVKYKIEQDKYCSRKIIIDSNEEWLDENKIMNYIQMQLFTLKIEKKIDGLNDIALASKLFNSDNAELANLFLEFTQLNNKKLKKEKIQNYLNERRKRNEI
ncbi:ABC-three component system middle component 1 [Paenibacillus sp. FSL H8-0317]|uniref:ABC-three component system middle component 1 n=1 Tax=unclassified Paenibacillus TaxID=185978 RepID=UPI0030D0117C